MATAAAKRKRGVGGKFVGNGRAKPAKPGLAALVDGRMVALEKAITANTEQSTESVKQLEQRVSSVLQEVASSVSKLPFEAADAVATGMEERLSEGTKQLHRRVRVIVSDRAGVRLTDQTFDLADFEKLDIAVCASSVTAAQASSDKR